jgi:flavin-dependent dehydrogenase
VPDVVVVGAGIAGCAVTFDLVANGYSVAVVHRADLADAIESLSPYASHELGRLGIPTGTPVREIFAWWGKDECSVAHYPGACVQSRSRLAARLRAAVAAAGAELVECIGRVRVRRNGLTWLIECGPAAVLTAPLLIDATGRASVVARQLGARRVSYDRLVAASMNLEGTGPAGVWTEATSTGWWNLSRSADGATLTYFSDDGVARRGDFRTEFGSVRHLRQLLLNASIRSTTIRPAGSSLLVPCAGAGWLAVGDAAATFQPLTSAGVAKALRDGERVREAVSWGPALYVARQQHHFADYLLKLRDQYSVAQRAPPN